MNAKQRLAALRKQAKPATKKKAPAKLPLKKIATQDISKTPLKIERANLKAEKSGYMFASGSKDAIKPEHANRRVQAVENPDTTSKEYRAIHGEPIPKNFITVCPKCRQLSFQNGACTSVKCAEKAALLDNLGVDKQQLVKKLAPTLENAAKLVQMVGIAATSIFVAHMDVGYPDTVRLIDALEKAGVIAPNEGLSFHGASYRRVYNIQREDS